jgi:hypothetical protein
VYYDYFLDVIDKEDDVDVDIVVDDDDVVDEWMINQKNKWSHDDILLEINDVEA